MPPPQKTLLENAHMATARLVTEEGNRRFVNYLERTNADETMQKTLFPFWKYDTKGGAFYGWLFTHVPGAAESQARLVQDTTQDPGGVGYFQGDYGVFGNEADPERGLWPYRIESALKAIARTRPDGLTQKIQSYLDDIVNQGVGGFRVSPVLEVGSDLLRGQPFSALPPAAQAGVDAYSGVTGQQVQNDPFTQRGVADLEAGAGADPYNPTPEQQSSAVRQYAVRNLADLSVPMFLYTAPQRTQERTDLTNAMVGLGYSKQVQAQWALDHPKNPSVFGMLDAEQKRTLMAAHPGWQYIFEASSESLPPEQLKQRVQISDYLNTLSDLTQGRLADQKKIDQKLAPGPNQITPQAWMDQRSKRMQQLIGARNFVNGQPLSVATEKLLSDAAVTKIVQPQDQAVARYWTTQADLITKNTNDQGVIDWSAVDGGLNDLVAGLPPDQQQYLQTEITRNQTPVEKSWHVALNQLTEYDAIPQWTGMSEADATKKSQLQKTYNQLIAAHRPDQAAALKAANPLLKSPGRTNPERLKYALTHPELAYFFVRPTPKNSRAGGAENPANFDPLTVPWQDASSGGTAPDTTGNGLPPTPLTPTDPLAAAG